MLEGRRKREVGPQIFEAPGAWRRRSDQKDKAGVRTNCRSYPWRGRGLGRGTKGERNSHSRGAAIGEGGEYKEEGDLGLAPRC